MRSRTGASTGVLTRSVQRPAWISVRVGRYRGILRWNWAWRGAMRGSRLEWAQRFASRWRAYPMELLLQRTLFFGRREEPLHMFGGDRNSKRRPWRYRGRAAMKP